MLRRLVVLFLLAACSHVPASRNAPIADHHQHLFSPAVAAMLQAEGNDFKALDGQQMVAHLDAAGIRRGAVLSVAYMYGSPNRTVTDELAKVQAENDWVAAQVAAHPDRLAGFCSVNPLKDYALGEIERCAKMRHLRTGLKMHFGNSDVQVGNPEHLAKMQAVFRAANAHRMALAIHMRASIRNKRPYGADEARIFLEQLLPLAKDVPVQIAHLAGSGPYYNDPASDAAMAVLAEAAAKGDPRTRNLWFDASGLARMDMPADQAARMVERIRQAGVKRVLYGSDTATPGNSPKEAWEAFKHLPLTETELAQIENNVAPYLR